jgi:hypothetical protein
MDWKRIRDKIDKNSYENFDEFKKEWDKFKTDHWNWWQRNNPWDSQNPDFLSYLNQANSYAQHAFNNGVGP